MILEPKLEQGLRWYFGFGESHKSVHLNFIYLFPGMSVATLSLAGMGLLHQSLGTCLITVPLCTTSDVS